MTETPGWTSPGSPEPPSGGAGTGHSAPPAPAALLAPPTAPAGTAGPAAPAGKGGPGIGLIPLRPLGFGELMDGAFALVRRNWRAAFGLSLVLAVVLQVIQANIDWWIHVNGTEPAALFSGSYLWPLEVFFGVLASGLIAPVVANGLLGRDTSPAQAWARVRPRLGRLLLLCLLLAGITVGAIAVAVVPLFVLAAVSDQPALVALMVLTLPPVVWLAVRLTLAVPALVLEQQPVLGAVKRSWRLTRRAWWRIFGLLLLFRICLGLVGAVLLVPGEIAAMIVEGWPAPPATAAPRSASPSSPSSASSPAPSPSLLGGALEALIYTDQRIRREALDLELARTAGLPGYGPSAATTPPGA
ncbi:glycerophosphoryl diester phosphodiesterase membrane domain-containing protein [Kitasatospora saccharophila]|uniref:glycerophosphoryl diester phosphodiesterase membrane domain-containing protein n=1 Tax=Kitasatospora saccharophila TaxID=407973 RepID=UPI003624F08F